MGAEKSLPVAYHSRSTLRLPFKRILIFCFVCAFEQSCLAYRLAVVHDNTIASNHPLPPLTSVSLGAAPHWTLPALAMSTTDATYAHRVPACRPHDGTAPVDCGGGAANTNESRFSLCLHAIVTFCWAASRGALQRMLITYLQSTVVHIWRSVIVSRGGQGCAEPATKEGAAQDPAAWGMSAPTTPAKNVSWSYLRGAHTVCRPRSWCAVIHQSPARRSVSCLERTLPRL